MVGEVGEAEEAEEAICHAHLKRSTSHICDLAETEGGERERERERERGATPTPTHATANIPMRCLYKGGKAARVVDNKTACFSGQALLIGRRLQLTCIYTSFGNGGLIIGEGGGQCAVNRYFCAACVKRCT